jgi:hypothetical protein
MKPVTTPEDRLLSIDQLDRDIVTLATRINAASCELLVLIRQFDERAVPNCGYLAQDMVDDSSSELSRMINNPPAEGFLCRQKKAVANATANRYETNSIRDSQFVTSTSFLTM